MTKKKKSFSSTLVPFLDGALLRKFLLKAKLRYSTLGTLFKIKTHVHLLNSNTAVFFLFISFPSFIFPLFQTKPSHEKTPKPQNCFLLFLSLIPSLLLKLDEMDESSSLNSLSCSVFVDWLAGTKKIRLYVFTESHYRFSILVDGFVLF